MLCGYNFVVGLAKQPISDEGIRPDAGVNQPTTWLWIIITDVAPSASEFNSF